MPRTRTRPPRLGELERAVLDYLWSVQEADVLQTHAEIGKRRGITPNTVGSALERLHRKALVAREKVSHAYRYRATVTRDVFAARQMLAAAGESRTLSDAGLLSAFIDLVADEDAASLDRLEVLIAEKRNEQGDA